METLAIFMVSVISTFYANQVAFSQPSFPSASAFSWGNFATSTTSVNSKFNNNINNINNSIEKSVEKIFIDTKSVTNSNANNNNSYGVVVQTKCINGVCNTVQKYLNESEARANSEKIQRDVEARIAEHKKKMDDRMREVFGNF
jgi:hypothetical protein